MSYFKKYEELSYYGKLKILLYMIFTATIFFVITLGFVFILILSNQLYERNQQKLSIITLGIENELSNIE